MQGPFTVSVWLYLFCAVSPSLSSFQPDLSWISVELLESVYGDRAILELREQREEIPLAVMRVKPLSPMLIVLG